MWTMAGFQREETMGKTSWPTILPAVLGIALVTALQCFRDSIQADQLSPEAIARLDRAREPRSRDEAPRGRLVQVDNPTPNRAADPHCSGSDAKGDGESICPDGEVIALRPADAKPTDIHVWEVIEEQKHPKTHSPAPRPRNTWGETSSLSEEPQVATTEAHRMRTPRLVAGNQDHSDSKPDVLSDVPEVARPATKARPVRNVGLSRRSDGAAHKPLPRSQERPLAVDVDSPAVETNRRVDPQRLHVKLVEASKLAQREAEAFNPERPPSISTDTTVETGRLGTSLTAAANTLSSSRRSRATDPTETSSSTRPKLASPAPELPDAVPLRPAETEAVLAAVTPPAEGDTPLADTSLPVGKPHLDSIDAPLVSEVKAASPADVVGVRRKAAGPVDALARSPKPSDSVDVDAPDVPMDQQALASRTDQETDSDDAETRQTSEATEPETDELPENVKPSDPTTWKEGQDRNLLLIMALQDSDRYVRKWAAEVLGPTGDKRAVKPLIRLLDDSDWSVRRSVMYSLMQMKDDRAVKPLISVLRKGTDKDRQLAAVVLGRMNATKAVATLIDSLTDSDWEVREACAIALGQLGDRKALAALRRAAADEDEDVKRAARRAIQRVTESKQTVAQRDDEE
jgi:hypothetical protein